MSRERAMHPLALFSALGPILGRLVVAEWGRKDLCILGAHAALEVCDYFGVQAQAVPVRVILYNAAFAKKLIEGVTEEETRAEWWKHGPYYSIGVGYGRPVGSNGWDGHLIVAAGDVMGDFMIQQAERPERGVVTGPAVVSAYQPPAWSVENSTGTVIHYEVIEDHLYLASPDWRDRDRRHRVVGRAIRAIKNMRRNNATVRGGRNGS